MTGIPQSLLLSSDSVSVATTFKAEFAKIVVLFMPISEAVQKPPHLVKKYLHSVVPISDNFFATLVDLLRAARRIQRNVAM